MPTLSVIIPAHNTGDYLRRCLDSVTAQTLKDIEIIIVNDCSPDPQDRKIALEFRQSDQRVIYIEHDESRYTGGARNSGLEVASAELVTFIDSDDWIETTAYERAVGQLRATQADIVVFGYRRLSVDGSSTFEQKYKQHTIALGPETNIFGLCNPGVCNKVFRSALFVDRDIRFPENINHEDLAVTPRLIHFARSISFLEDCPYHYLQRQSSANRTFTTVSIDNYFKVFALLARFMREQKIYDRQCKHYHEMIYKSLAYHCSLSEEGVSRERKSYMIKSLYSMPDIDDYLELFTDIELDKVLLPRRSSKSLVKKFFRSLYRRVNSRQS